MVDVLTSTPMSNDSNTYLKQDMLTLLALGIIIAGVLGALGYLESHGGRFSQFASRLLDSKPQ